MEKRAMYCGLPFVEELEIFLLEACPRLALAVADHHRHHHQVDARLEHRRLVVGGHFRGGLGGRLRRGCSMGTVASRLNRAHKTLERRLWHLKGSSHE
jgi:hypothetical protein